VPQLSLAVTLPQFLASRVQNAALVSAVQPHTLVALHVCGDVHVPQLATVREMPQLSLAVTLPQVLPRRVQKAGLVSFVHPHTLTVLPPPHVCGAVHVPQLFTVRIVPQLSAAVTLPQFLDRRVQNAAFDSAVQPHTLTVPPPPHVCGVVHVPQLAVRLAPQLSFAVTLPQFLPTRAQNVGFVSATQFGPQTLATPPPPQVIGIAQVPQFVAMRVAPQLSVPVKLPQLLPSRMQNAISDSGVHMTPHTFTVPPPPHVCGAMQVPQLDAVRIAPQLSGAVTIPQVLLSRAQNVGSDSGVQASLGVPPSEDAPAEPPPTPPTPAPDAPPVVVAAGEPPEPVVGPAPDDPVAVLVVLPVAPPDPPPVPVPDVTPTGSVPAEPVEGPPPVFVPSPGSAPSTPCAHEANASAANTSATR
jgi:hypothetical protein